MLDLLQKYKSEWVKVVGGKLYSQLGAVERDINHVQKVLDTPKDNEDLFKARILVLDQRGYLDQLARVSVKKLLQTNQHKEEVEEDQTEFKRLLDLFVKEAREKTVIKKEEEEKKEKYKVKIVRVGNSSVTLYRNTFGGVTSINRNGGMGSSCIQLANKCIINGKEIEYDKVLADDKTYPWVEVDKLYS